MNPSRRSALKQIAVLALIPFCNARAGDTPQVIRINVPGPRSLPFVPIELIPILGLDRSANLQLVIRYFPSGVRALEDMLAGNADFSAQGFTVLYPFHMKGNKVQALAPLSGNSLPFGIVVRSDLRGQVKSIADLRGHSIGISIGNPTSKTYMQHVLEVLLNANGVRPDEVRMVPTAQNWDGQIGALSSKAVDAVYCEEPFMSGLVRNKTGFLLSDLSSPKIMAMIPGAGHLRASLTTTAANLAQNPQLSQAMVNMLGQSLAWMKKAGPKEIVDRLGIEDRQERLQLVQTLKKQHRMYASDARFSRQQIAATGQFMREAGILTDTDFDINTLINSQYAGVRP